MKQNLPIDMQAMIDDVSHHQYLFADFELNRLTSLVKELYDTFKRAKKRFDRKETLELSPSLCKYIQSRVDALEHPFILYSFVNDGQKVMVYQHKKKYYVYCNFSVSKRFSCYRTGFNSELYGNFDFLADAVQLFLNIVCDYTLDKIKDKVVPF